MFCSSIKLDGNPMEGLEVNGAVSASSTTELENSDDAHGYSISKLPREVQLIKYVAREQALYNPKHEFYRNAARKDVKWSEIGAAIGWTEAQCKAKWKAFRDQYCRELKRSKINPKATVRWKYFKYLEFLRPFALSRNYRPRYVPNNNSNEANINNSATSTDEDKKNINACILTSDYNLLQNIKMEPKTQQDEQQSKFVNECGVLTSSMNVSNSTVTSGIAESNIKNETIVVIAAEQLQHLNNVLQQQQQQQPQQQQHAENWGFLTNTTNDASNLLTTTSHHHQHHSHHQQQNISQQQLSNNFGLNNNENENNVIDTKHIDHTSNSSADYSLFDNAIADCVAAAATGGREASHQSQTQTQTQSQQQQLQSKLQQQQEMYMFQAQTVPMATTSSDEEDDDPIHKFLNIESYFEKELIAMVQSEDILYNSFHPNYRNAKRKLSVWADIARRMKKTVKQCRLKWKALRDQYIREHKRLRNRINIENLPRWKHYDALNFLHNFIKHKSEIEEKKIFQMLKSENVDNDESVTKNQGKETTQQQLQLHTAFIGLSNALMEHQRQQQQQHHHQQQQQQFHDDIKSSVTISSSSSIATTINDVQANSRTLIDINENHSNSADDYDAIDIDNYINGDGAGSDIVMHDNVDDDLGEDNCNDDNGIDNSSENDKTIPNMQNYNQTNRSECTLINNSIDSRAIEPTQNQVNSLPSSSDFRKLKDVVSKANSPSLISISNSQQQLCQQSQNNQQQQQQQHQHQPSQHSHHQDGNDHIMQVVGLSCDDVVVLNKANAGHLGFVVSSSATVVTTSTATTSMAPAKPSLTIHQRDFTEHLVKLTSTQTTNSPTSTVMTGATLAPINSTNNVFYNSNNNNNGNNNNDLSIASAAAHDVNNVFSAIATCADFAASFDDCSTSTIAATSLPLSLTPTAATTPTKATTTSSSSISNSNLILPTDTLNSSIATTALPSSTTSTVGTTVNAITASTLPTYANNFNDDDEVGVFFKAIAMKIRSVNLSPIEFTDLQIEVLRVINQSLRKN